MKSLQSIYYLFFLLDLSILLLVLIIEKKEKMIFNDCIGKSKTIKVNVNILHVTKWH